MRLNRSRDGVELDDSILEMKRLAQRTAQAPSLDVLRGYEGRSAVVYFDGFARGFLADEATFTKRTRRPPTDPVNALLSLGYTLLFNTVMAAVSLVGFDPYLGCFHAVDYGRPSLALDLMEEWRPVIVDSLVLSVFNLKSLSLADFVTAPANANEVEDEQGPDLTEAFDRGRVETKKTPCGLPVRLTDTGFRKFISQFERKMAEKVRFAPSNVQLSYRDCIREQARHFARCVRGEETAYQPFIWKCARRGPASLVTTTGAIERLSMYVVVSYDIVGDRTRTLVMKRLKNFGRRVQLSVFECDLDEQAFARMKRGVEALIDRKVDAVRYYRICHGCKSHVMISGWGEIMEEEGFEVI